MILNVTEVNKILSCMPELFLMANSSENLEKIIIGVAQ